MALELMDDDEELQMPSDPLDEFRSDEQKADREWEALMLDYREAQRAEDDAKAHREKIKALLVERLHEERFKAKTVRSSDDPTQQRRVVLSTPHRITVDESVLKKAVGARAFNKVTKRVVDKELLDAAVADPEMAEFTKESVGPALKVSSSTQVRLYEMAYREEENDGRPEE